MIKKKQKILLFFLFAFSIYCALKIGQSWDEAFHLIQGKTTLDYLFSLGKIDKDILYRENYSTIYWSFSYLLTMIFPSQYQIEVSHLINLAFSLSTIVGVGKISTELFNKKIGKIVFLILFFYPIFFGHMSFNNSDTILAFGHIWITYFILRYLKKQNIKYKRNSYVIYISALAALSTGIQLVFLSSLIPIFLFILIEVFYSKKITNKNFSNKKFLYDCFKCFIFFYFLLILFWIDVYPNIFVLPFNIIIETFSDRYWTGWPYNLINGTYYISDNVPKFYFLINFIYKTPEYFLISYLIFFVLLLKCNKFFVDQFRFFNYKISLVILILIFPNLILLASPYPLYDGMRLFLWTLPYFCIIPGLTIYYLLKNFNKIKSKLTLLFLSFFIVYFLFIFFTITPYQYTYLNFLNGKIENRFRKFENDYWASSINELIKNTNFEKNRTITFATCGVSSRISKYYLKKERYSNFIFVSPKQADYIIMTNRVVSANEKNNESKKLVNCFDRFNGEDAFKVTRNGLLLSVIRQINYFNYE